MKSFKRMILLLLAFLSVQKVSAGHEGDSVIVKLDVLVGLQYDVVRFNVKPGAKVKLIFSNSDDMSHNLLITKPGTRLQVVNEALQLGEKGPAMNYIPNSPSVLWSIPVVNPNQIKFVSFTAPQQTGVYPYVCTLPGHGFVMFGAMYVGNGEDLPDIKNDPNIPPNRRQEANPSAKAHNGHVMEPEKQLVNPKPLHPYKPVSPYLYRVFIKDSSPAAIAVSLPNDLSYCWDAGTCRLRYAWSGGFVDNSELWKGKGDVLAKVVGTVFFTDKTDFPLQINPDQVPVVDYKGYKLINRYPEFHYTLNGIDVYELILPKADGNGILRTFRIPRAAGTVYFARKSGDGVTYKASAGKWEGEKLKLSAGQAKNFTVTMTRKEGGA